MLLALDQAQSFCLWSKKWFCPNRDFMFCFVSEYFLNKLSLTVNKRSLNVFFSFHKLVKPDTNPTKLGIWKSSCILSGMISFLFCFSFVGGGVKSELSADLTLLKHLRQHHFQRVVSPVSYLNGSYAYAEISDVSKIFWENSSLFFLSLSLSSTLLNLFLLLHSVAYWPVIFKLPSVKRYVKAHKRKGVTMLITSFYSTFLHQLCP